MQTISYYKVAILLIFTQVIICPIEANVHTNSPKFSSKLEKKKCKDNKSPQGPPGPPRGQVNVLIRGPTGSIGPISLPYIGPAGPTGPNGRIGPTGSLFLAPTGLMRLMGHYLRDLQRWQVIQVQ